MPTGVLNFFTVELSESLKTESNSPFGLNTCITPIYPSLTYNLLMLSNDYKSAAKEYSKAASIKKNDISYKIKAANAYSKTDKNVKALKYYEEILEIQPYNIPNGATLIVRVDGIEETITLYLSRGSISNTDWFDYINGF